MPEPDLADVCFRPGKTALEFSVASEVDQHPAPLVLGVHTRADSRGDAETRVPAMRGRTCEEPAGLNVAKIREAFIADRFVGNPLAGLPSQSTQVLAPCGVECGPMLGVPRRRRGVAVTRRRKAHHRRRVYSPRTPRDQGWDGLALRPPTANIRSGSCAV
jgi:hypothetical protein